MGIWLNVLLFFLGALLLIKGGDWLVDGATGLARRFHLPELLVGATVVSIGTTLPEVMVSSTAALADQSSTAYGNAIGSIICNTALIAAITVLVRPGKVNRKALITPVAFFFAAAAIYLFAAYVLGEFTRPIGIVFLAMFLVYMVVTVRQGFAHPESVELEQEEGGKPHSLGMNVSLLVIGVAIIALGANLVVDNVPPIARALGVSEAVIALTFVALSTSLPELVTAITSLVKGHSSLSLGNVIGANLFNLVLVCGISVTVSPFEVPLESTFFGYNASLALELPVMLGVMLLLTVPALARRKLSHWQGALLLVIYALFVLAQFLLCVNVTG